MGFIVALAFFFWIVCPGTSASAGEEVPDEFRGAGAVVLEDTSVLTNNPPKSKYERTVRLKILTPQGFSYADQGIYYDRRSAELTRFEARTLLPNGQVVEVPPDLRRDVVAWKNESVEMRSLLFTFPAVEVGSVLQWSYEVSYSSLRERLGWEIQREIPVLEARFVSRFPSTHRPVPWIRMVSRAPSERWCQENEPEPDEKDVFRTIGEVVCRRIPGYRDEEDAPPEADARLEATIVHHFLMVPDLSDRIKTYLNEEWSKRAQRCSGRKGRVRATARNLVAGAATQAERIDRIYRYVTESIAVRGDSEVEEQMSGDRPCLSVDEVLESKGGSTDEMAFLALAMLEEAGVPARLVLVTDRSEEAFAPSVPDATQYAHLLIELGAAENRGYLDPSCKYCVAGAPDWRYCGEGSGGLRIVPNARRPDEVTLRGVPAHLNVESVRQRVLLEADGSARLEGSAIWQLQADVSVRRAMEELTEEGREELFLERVSGDIEDARVTVMDPANLRENMRVDFEFRQRDLAHSVQGLLLVHPPDLFTRRLDLPLQETRQLPVWWPFARSVRSESVFVLPQGYTVLHLPPDVAVAGPGLKFEARWGRGANEGEILWRGLLTVSRTSIPPEEYPEARRFVVELRDALRQGMVLSGSSRGPS